MSIGKAAVLNIAVLLSPLLTEAEQVLCGSDRQNAEVRAAIFNVRDFGAKGDNTSGAHLVLCVGQTDVMMRGPGKIDGNVSAFLRDKDGKHPSSKRQIVWRTSQMIWFVDSQRIRFRNIDLTEGFEAVNAPDVKAEDGTFCELPLSDAERAKLAAGIDAHTIRLH